MNLKISPKSNKGKLKFCFVGRLTFEKDLMFLELIKHYGKNKNIEWLIIGNGN